MDWLRQYLAAERRKLRGLSRRAKAEYIWQYYKLWIIGILAAVALPIYITVHRLTTPIDNWFYVTFANTYAEVGSNSPLWREFVDYAGFDTTEKNVYFNNNCYFDPASEAYNAYYTYFVAYVEAGTLDGIVMERDDLQTLGRRGRLLDLRDAWGLADRYPDRLIYAVPADPEYGSDPVPIGIDLSDTRLVTSDHAYADTCALGVSVNCPHPDALSAFLQFVIGEGTT